MDIEIWKDIKGFEGIYQISNLGRARSLKRNRVYILKNNIDTHGYYYIIPYVNKKNYTHYKIHRLVALYFVSGYKKGLVVNHKDGDKRNNHYSNLEWVTSSENNQHAYNIGLKRKQISDIVRHAAYKKISKSAICIDIINNKETYYKSLKSAAKSLGLTDTGIAYSISKNTIYKKRYKFSYESKIH